MVLRFAEAREFQRFIIISQPAQSKISWAKLPEDEGVADYTQMKTEVLLDTGLSTPQGVAVDHKRKRLYIADPEVQKIFSYQLQDKGGVLSTDGRQTVINQGMEVRWVAVDGMGNVFFTDEPSSRIMKLSSEHVLRGEQKPQVMYSGTNVSSVSKPGGIYADNFHVYWGNKHFASEVGSLVKASEFPKVINDPAACKIMAKGAQKAYGVTMALNNVFFTDADKKLYGVKRNGGEVFEITQDFTHPRGLAYDGRSTVFVADKTQGVIKWFSGNMHVLGPVDMNVAFHVPDAFGVAVARIAGASRCGQIATLLLGLFLYHTA
jgi:DNA-binding beta-propeller fold protein YncE